MRLRALANQQLKKHVGAIHIRGKLSLLQRKVSNVLLLNAYEGLREKEMHSIRIKELAEVIGFDSKNIEALKEALRGLTDIKIEWNILDQEGREAEWGRSSMLAGVTILSGRGVCRYSYYKDLREKLYNPAVYARINLSVQRDFRSSYALALYENCVRFRKTGSTGWIELDTWRDLLGVREGTYPAFKEFRRRVLNPAIKEVNEHSDIMVTLEPPRRHKRRIVALKFAIKNNPQLSLGLENKSRLARYEVVHEEKEEERGPLVERLAAFGLEAQASDIIARHDEARISGNLDIIEAKITRGDRIESIPAIARDAIEKDYRPKKTNIEQEVEGKKAETRRQREATLEAQRLAEEERRSEQEAQNRELDARIEALSTERRAELEELAERRYMQVLGIRAFNKYQKEKETGSVPKFAQAMMRGYRRDIIESPEFAVPAEEVQS